MAHGGKREGSGRKPGALNTQTAEVKFLAQKHGPTAIKRLVHLIDNAESEQAQVAASKEILDRAYGKATQPMQHSVDEGLESLLDRLGQSAGSA